MIAVDMFLNLVTTNPGEVKELLDNLLPAVVGVLWFIFLCWFWPLSISARKG